MTTGSRLRQRPREKNMPGIVLFLCAFSFIFASGAVSAQGLDKSEIWSLYRDGEASFRQGTDLIKTDPQKAKDLFQKALLSFERINREGGIENGKLYYNIGNIHFRLGDMGSAILNYRRAESFMPHNMNLQQNLEYARSRCADKIDARPRDKVFQTLFFWHYDLNLRIRSLLFLICFNLVWILAAIYLFGRKGWLRNAIVVCAVFSLFLGGSVGVESFQQSRTRSGVILSKEIIARKGDSTTFEPTFKDPLHAGAEFTLVEERNGWYHIELGDGRQCWVPESSAELIQSPFPL
jgi:hypothetical protein